MAVVEAANSVSQAFHIEVEQQGGFQIRMLQVRESLRDVYGQKALDRLQLEQDPSFDDEIRPVRGIDCETIELDLHGHFRFETQMSLGDPVPEARMVGAFQQSRPHSRVNVERARKDAFGNIVEGILQIHHQRTRGR
ncbi:MAG TPA: hypothetical protein VFV90_07855 [Usitatibacter sp.]|nr:hypothetical protein [Usitatibacter sp.]